MHADLNLAVIPGGGGTQRLQRLIRPSLAKLLTFTAVEISAPTAAHIGVVDFVVGIDDPKLALFPELYKHLRQHHKGLGKEADSLKHARQVEFADESFANVDFEHPGGDAEANEKVSKEGEEKGGGGLEKFTSRKDY